MCVIFKLCFRGMAASGKRKKEKDPNAPKRPSTPYFAFMNDNRATIKKENPDCAVSDVGKIAGKMWAELDPETKQEYTDDYQVKMDEWRQKMEAYGTGSILVIFDQKNAKKNARNFF